MLQIFSRRQALANFLPVSTPCLTVSFSLGRDVAVLLPRVLPAGRHRAPGSSDGLPILLLSWFRRVAAGQLAAVLDTDADRPRSPVRQDPGVVHSDPVVVSIAWARDHYVYDDRMISIFIPDISSEMLPIS